MGGWRSQMSKQESGSKAPLIQVEKIEKWYGSVHALKGVSLSVNNGEIVGLIGDNGAGKSTLIKIISGVLKKSRGHIYWKGEEVEITSVKKARTLGIETVYQDRAVIGTMSVAHNIFLGREPTKRLLFFKRLDYPSMRREAVNLAHELNLNIPSADQEVRFCSGGEMQGVAISRAMYFKASLVILDEPTTALAVSGARQVLNFTKRLKSEGIACIFVTHNLHDVYSVADLFIVMRQGQIVGDIGKNDVTVDDLISMLLSEKPIVS
jgi:simple sugar transport system ATP-binding protein